VRVHAVSRSEDDCLSVYAAYDAIAAEYDDQVSGDTWMRQTLHAHYARVFAPGVSVLDVGCGTGIDALALARRGVRVLGIDGSARMIERLRSKAAVAGAGDLVQARVLDIQDLGELDDGPFDGIISAFASLSSLADLSGFAIQAARLVRPGGHAVLHLLNRFSMWEWLGYLRRGDWTAARQVGRLSSRRFVIGGVSVEHALYSGSEAYRRFFEPWFVRRARYGLGAIRPPHTVRRVPPRLARTLEWLDIRSGRWPIVRDCGRFFVLDLERRAR
jgi:2-polyprenyl-3-methyl-5-hydroxy-6-metoxy-1,4-benzoquinol methylase